MLKYHCATRCIGVLASEPRKRGKQVSKIKIHAVKAVALITARSEVGIQRPHDRTGHPRSFLAVERTS